MEVGITDNELILSLGQSAELAQRQQLREINTVTARYGLTLSENDIAEIVERRREALRDTGRVEFGGGIAPRLAYAFCDSPYITREDYCDTLLTLQDAFYYFKGEAMETISDDELIRLMRRTFDGPAHGSLDYLCETTLEDICRNTRFGYGSDYQEPDEEEICDED